MTLTTMHDFTLDTQISFPMELLQRLAVVGLIIIATWIISRTFQILISKAVGKFSQKVAQQAGRFAKWLIWLIGILVAVDQLGLELTVVLIFIILGGIAVLFAFRDVLSDLISYETINAYGPFKIGDWIEVDKHFGRVVDITWTNTILMTPDNETLYVPNSKITKSIIVNKTTPGGIRISVPLTVSKTLDFSEVEKTLLLIASEFKEEFVPESKPEVRVAKTDNKSIKLVLLLKINNPAKSEFMASEIQKRAKNKLDEIERKISLEQHSLS